MKNENNISAIHIGSIIEKIAVEKKVTKAQMARMIHRHATDISDIYKRKSINTDQLVQISIALDYNFFKEIYVKYLDTVLHNRDYSGTVTIVIENEKVSIEQKNGTSITTKYRKVDEK